LSAGTNSFTAASPTDPRSQVNQLILLGAGGFASGDLLIVGEGSSNDAATLATAYLTDVQTSGATTLFAQVITSLLQDGGATAGLGIGAPDGGATAGVVYMTQLAQTLVATVKTEALDKGATRVAILNTLDVTRTPRFQTVLAGIAAQQNQAAADGVQALVRAWINAYNSALRAAVVPYAGKVVIVDAFQGFNDELDNLAQYGLTNKTSTVCFETFAAAGGTKTGASPQPVLPGTIGLGDDDVSTPVPPICNDTYASSITPTENATGTNWWKTYLFADNFHPTPYGHQLLAQLVAKRLTEAGWL
jgi:outer membrane lipase/esterase